MGLTFDSAINSIGKAVDAGVGAYNSYTESQTAQQVQKQQSQNLWESQQAQNTALVNNSKMWLIGGVILAIGAAFFMFNRKS